MSTYSSLDLTSAPMFLGAYIKDISSSMGYSTSPSTCNVTLVEDPDNGVEFQEPILGRYYTISIGSHWSFSGIVMKWDRDVANTGGHQIQLVLNDAREAMKNVPLILAPGAQPIVDGLADSHCSLLDIFGSYWYQGAYNISGWNQAGLEYKRIASALKGENVTIGSYVFNVPKLTATVFGERYAFDMTEVNDIVNDSYRVNTNFITLLELIEDLAKRNAFDWFIETSQDSSGLITIAIKVIDRSEDNTDISFQEFLDLNGGLGNKIITATSGLELRNEINCLVMLGAPVESITKVAIQGLANEPIDLSTEGGSSAYYMTETEMRAVLDSKESWQIWLSIPTAYGGGNGFSRYGGSLQDNYVNSLINALTMSADILDGSLTDKNRTRVYLASVNFEKVGKVYEKLKAHAEATYGKRFVHSPIYDEIIDSAWTRDVIAGNDNANEFFRQDDGRTRAYVEFSNEDAGGAFSLGLSDLRNTFAGTDLFSSVIAYGENFENTYIEGSAILGLENTSLILGSGVIHTEKSNYTYNENSDTLYIACTVEKDGTVRIDGPVLEAQPDVAEFMGKLLAAQAESESRVPDFTDSDGNFITSENHVRQTIYRVFGEAPFMFHSKAYQPKYVYIPTRSRINRYGPVFSSNINEDHRGGKLEIIQDDGFAPWEFGSISLMNTAMQIKVDEATAPQTDVQVGSVEVEGLPIKTIGAFIGLNSNITNVNISFGSGGVKTSYTLNSFTRKFGEFSKEDFAKLALFATNAGARTLPQGQISFVYRHNYQVNKNFSGKGGLGSSPTSGGAYAF